MGICRDRATTYLNRFGFNVLRRPTTGLAPLQLLARAGDQVMPVGTLPELVAAAAGPVPPLETDLRASDINGLKSDWLEAALGLGVLQNAAGALGVEASLAPGFAGVRKLFLELREVLSDRVASLGVAEYLGGATIDPASPLVSEFVIGSARLYCVVQTLRTNQLTVRYEADDEREVDVKALQRLLGKAITASADSAAAVALRGDTELTFAFKCFEIGVVTGDVVLIASRGSSQPMPMTPRAAAGATPYLFEDYGLVDYVEG